MLVVKLRKSKKTAKVQGVQTYNYLFTRVRGHIFLDVMSGVRILTDNNVDKKKFSGDFSRNYFRFLKGKFFDSVEKVMVEPVDGEYYAWDLYFLLFTGIHPSKVHGDKLIVELYKKMWFNSYIVNLLVHYEDYSDMLLDCVKTLLKAYLGDNVQYVRVRLGGVSIVDVLRYDKNFTPLLKGKFIEFSDVVKVLMSGEVVDSYDFTSLLAVGLVKVGNKIVLTEPFSDNELVQVAGKGVGFRVVHVRDLLSKTKFVENWYKAYRLHGGDLSVDEFIKRGGLPFGKQVELNGKYYSYTVLVDDPGKVVRYEVNALDRVVGVKGVGKENIIIVYNDEENIEKGVGSEVRTTDYLFFL